LAGVGVDFDLDDMGAVGVGHPFARPGVIGVERRACLSRHCGDVDKRHRAVRTRHDKAAALKPDVGF
jgi:hypothetical protein